MKYDMNDTRTPRERIGDPLLQRMLEESRAFDKLDGGCPLCDTSERRGSDCRGQRRTAQVAARPMPSMPSKPSMPSMPPMQKGHCGGEGYSGWGLSEHPLAMAYSPLHVWRQVYDADYGFGRGTIFAELDLPFGADDSKGGCRYE